MPERGALGAFWLLPLEFTVRELDVLDLPVEASEDPEALVFVLGHGQARTLVCPAAVDPVPGGGGWRALLIGGEPDQGVAATVRAMLDTVDSLPSDCFVVSNWTQSYLMVLGTSLDEARDRLEAHGYSVFAPL